MNLTEHFTLEELTYSDTAVRLGIDNTPTAEALANLRVLAFGLEVVRAMLGHPMIIDSGYRCLHLNAAVGGSHRSAHMQGFAADFRCPKFGEPIDVCRAIAASAVGFDQLIHEGRWVHISFAPAKRRNVLTAKFGKTVTYLQGLQ